MYRYLFQLCSNTNNLITLFFITETRLFLRVCTQKSLIVDIYTLKRFNHFNGVLYEKIHTNRNILYQLRPGLLPEATFLLSINYYTMENPREYAVSE